MCTIKVSLIKFYSLLSLDGPFLISCGASSGLYLHVHPSTHEVLGTTNIETASEFHIIPTDGIGRANEFYIGFYTEVERTAPQQQHRYSVLSDRSRGSIVPLYLDAPLSICGTNSGPLHVWDTVADRTSRFVLYSRIVPDKGTLPVPLSSWTSGSDMFYINCSRRKHRRDGYLTVTRRPAGRNNPNETFVTTCMNRIIYHNNYDTFMLFQLLSIHMRDSSKRDEETDQKEELTARTGGGPGRETAEGVELQPI